MKGVTLAAAAITIIMCGAIGVFVYDPKKPGNRFQQRKAWKTTVAQCGNCNGLMINGKCARAPILPPGTGITVEADCGNPIKCYIDPYWQPPAKRTTVASSNYKNGKLSFLNTMSKGVVKFGKLGYGGRVLAEKFEARRAQAVGIVSIPDCYCLDEGNLRDDTILEGCKIGDDDEVTALEFLHAVVTAIGNDESDLTCETICGVDTATCEKYCDLADRRRNLKGDFGRALSSKGSGCGAGCSA
jgi:hypothetical protein